MTPGTHTFRELFHQLGLANEDDDIQRFIAAHSPLPDVVRVADAPFWSSAQASFLRDGLIQDSDWAELVDQLNAALRAA